MNLSTGIGCSVLDIVETAKEVTGRDISYSYKDRRKGDPPILISTFNKAEKLLKWTPQYSIHEIISSMWEIYKNN